MIYGIRLTDAGLRAVQHLAKPVIAPNAKTHTEHAKAEKLSNDKVAVLAVCGGQTTKWLSQKRLIRRLDPVTEYIFTTDKGIGRFIDDLLSLSADGFIELGRTPPVTCTGCGKARSTLFALAVVDNSGYDGLTTDKFTHTELRCKECFSYNE